MKFPSPRWMLGFAFAALVLGVLGGVGGFVLHLRQQRGLQHELDQVRGSNVSISWRDEHWLAEWVPEGLADGLPYEQASLSLQGTGDLSETVRIAKRFDSIASINVLDCQNVAEVWPLVQSHPTVITLEFQATPVRDEHVGRLATYARLADITIVEAPITDHSLMTLGQLPALQYLNLHDTDVTLAGITSFAAAHPKMTIYWSPRLTAAQRTARAKLKRRDVHASVRPMEAASAEDEVTWEYIHMHGRATLKDVELMRQLDGPIRQLIFGMKPSRKVVDELAQLPGLERIDWAEDAVFVEDLRAFAAIDSVKSLYFPFEKISAADLAEIKAKYPHKLENNAIPIDYSSDRPPPASD